MGPSTKSTEKMFFQKAQLKYFPQSTLSHQALGMQATPAAAFPFTSTKSANLLSLDFSQ